LRKKLQAQIDGATRGLQDVEEQRQKDREFVEQAFYTSNEEGMGVSPNSYEGQNRMPRKGAPTRDIKLTDPLEELGTGTVLPEQRIVKKAVARVGARASILAPVPILDEDKYEYYSSEDE